MIFYRAGLRGAECCIVRYSRAAVVEPYDEHDLRATAVALTATARSVASISVTRCRSA